MTVHDSKIRMADVPERFQLRTIPVRSATEGELDEEAEWIYKQAFMVPPISQQNFQVLFFKIKFFMKCTCCIFCS